MEASQDKFYTEAEYLVFDKANEFRSEFANGEIIVMAGASRAHNVITGATYASLYNQTVDRPCDAYQGDMRIQIKKARKTAYRYPDIVIVCGKREFVKDINPDTLMNPTVLIEVLSSSTASTDHVQKLDEYRQIQSVQAYLIIAQDEVRVLHYFLDNETWEFRAYTKRSETIDLPSIACHLNLNDIYRQVTFTDDNEGT